MRLFWLLWIEILKGIPWIELHQIHFEGDGWIIFTETDAGKKTVYKLSISEYHTDGYL